ncbi:hypothetical protein [Lachnospira multipara]|uniref:Uncharacterized protein n=1 Tax=Lachnospira multipara TaxID=28051 RepID=A0A1H5V7C6_9FIRM|nr:hypothetical protein [Lachnospira multipara]SEF83120.1 hypothetical protein SAMN05216537_11012 [Lachnospira multipara]
MRLRLDKLVLSAGLALAIVATSIPAIAGTAEATDTTGWSLNGTTVTIGENDETFGSAFEVSSQISAGDWVGTKKKVTASAPTIGNSNDVLNGQLQNEYTDISRELNSKHLTAVADGTKAPGKVTVKATYEFKLTENASHYDAAYDEEKNGTAEALKATLESAKDAEQTAAMTDEALKTLLGSGYTNAIVDVTDVSAVATIGSDYSVGNAASDNVAAKNTTASYSITTTVTATITTTQSELPSGYTYDVVTTMDSNTAYVLYSFDPDTEKFEEVTLTKVNNNKAVKYSITDLTKVYLLTSKAESTSDVLLFGDGDDDTADKNVQSGLAITGVTQTLVLNNRNASTIGTDVKTKFEASLNGYTHVAYFEATVGGGLVTELTDGAKAVIRIAKPQDIIDANEGKTITWQVNSVHEDEIINWPVTEDGNYLVVEADKFSIFELSYTTSAAATPAETPAEDPTSEAPANENDTQAAAPTTEAAQGSGTTSATGVKAGDNSMMPLFMTTLLLALCAGSLAIYKEKKTY